MGLLEYIVIGLLVATIQTAIENSDKLKENEEKAKQEIVLEKTKGK